MIYFLDKKVYIVRRIDYVSVETL